MGSHIPTRSQRDCAERKADCAGCIHQLLSGQCQVYLTPWVLETLIAQRVPVQRKPDRHVPDRGIRCGNCLKPLRGKAEFCSKVCSKAYKAAEAFTLPDKEVNP